MAFCMKPIVAKAYRASPAIWNHKVLTCHATQVNVLGLSPTKQASS